MFTAYSVLQVGVWWLCHAAAIFWKVRFPLRAKIFTSNKNDKYLHIISLLAGFLLPLVTIIVPIADAAVNSNTNDTTSNHYGYSRIFVHNGCYVSSRAASLSLYLPISIIVSLTITLFILICFYIHKASFSSSLQHTCILSLCLSFYSTYVFCRHISSTKTARKC